MEHLRQIAFDPLNIELKRLAQVSHCNETLMALLRLFESFLFEPPAGVMF
jgi:hypothetical protein